MDAYGIAHVLGWKEGVGKNATGGGMRGKEGRGGGGRSQVIAPKRKIATMNQKTSAHVCRFGAETSRRMSTWASNMCARVQIQCGYFEG